jgi:hypothetical protein
MTGRRFGMPFILSPPSLALQFRQNNGLRPTRDYQPSRSALYGWQRKYSEPLQKKEPCRLSLKQGMWRVFSPSKYKAKINSSAIPPPQNMRRTETYRGS